MDTHVRVLNFSKPVPHCLTDVSLIPPCDRILLQMTFADLYRWSIKELRQAVLQADHTFKSRGITPTMPSFNCQDNSNVYISKVKVCHSLIALGGVGVPGILGKTGERQSPSLSFSCLILS